MSMEDRLDVAGSQVKVAGSKAKCRWKIAGSHARK